MWRRGRGCGWREAAAGCLRAALAAESLPGDPLGLIEGEAGEIKG